MNKESFDTVKRALLMSGLYLVSIYLIIKGVNHLLEINIFNTVQTLLLESKFNALLPNFEWGSFNIERTATSFVEKIQFLFSELTSIFWMVIEVIQGIDFSIN